MKELRNGIKIIGIDHGYGNIKTTCFPFNSGVSDIDFCFKIFRKSIRKD